jgi:hypothetical protein
LLPGISRSRSPVNISEKTELDRHCDEKKVKRIEIDSKSRIVRDDDNGLVLFRPGTPVISSITKVLNKDVKNAIIQSMLELGGVDRNRDGDGIRISMGFGQIQREPKMTLLLMESLTRFQSIVC